MGMDSRDATSPLLVAKRRATHLTASPESSGRLSEDYRVHCQAPYLDEENIMTCRLLRRGVVAHDKCNLVVCVEDCDKNSTPTLPQARMHPSLSLHAQFVHIPSFRFLDTTGQASKRFYANQFNSDRGRVTKCPGE